METKILKEIILLSHIYRNKEIKINTAKELNELMNNDDEISMLEEELKYIKEELIRYIEAYNKI